MSWQIVKDMGFLHPDVGVDILADVSGEIAGSGFRERVLSLRERVRTAFINIAHVSSERAFIAGFALMLEDGIFPPPDLRKYGPTIYSRYIEVALDGMEHWTNFDV